MPLQDLRIHSILLSIPLVLLLAVLAGPAHAQEPTGDSTLTDQEEIRVEVTGSARPKLRLASPGLQRDATADPTTQTVTDELEETLLNDLRWSGVFEVQGPDVLTVLSLNGDRKHDFLQFQSLGNEVVLLSEVSYGDGKVTLEGKVYDLQSGRFIFGKRYAGSLDQNRRIAHSLNDEMVRYFTGESGIAKTQVVFVSNRDGLGVKELYLMDYDGANQRRISGHQSISLAPSWSPKNDGLAYVSYFEGPPSMYWVDINSGSKSPILVDETSTMSPTFSPKGDKIAFARSLRGNWEIFTVPTSGGNATRLTASNAIDTNPAWSPNGREIAFTSSRSGQPQLYVMDAEGTNPRRVTFNGNYNDGAEWHPLGSKLVYSHRDKSGSRFDIAMVDLVTMEERILTAGLPGNHEAPSFSPDGKRVVFQSNRAGGSQIFIMSATGGDIRQLTRNGSNTSPTWSNIFE